MPRWVLLAVLLAIAIYGWRQTSRARHGAHEVVAVNRSGRSIEQLDIRVAGERLAVASLAQGATARLPLRCDRDGGFEVVWRHPGAEHPHHWFGGSFHHGPVRMRHRLEFTRGEGVVWRTERITPAKKKSRGRRAKAG
jgi:hypothetical protein